LLYFAFGDKSVDQFFNGIAVVIVHLFHGLELLQKFGILQGRFGFFIRVPIDPLARDCIACLS
jgi:hypothetical protein